MAASSITVKVSVKKRLYFWPCLVVCYWLNKVGVMGDKQAQEWLFKNCVKVRVE